MSGTERAHESLTLLSALSDVQRFAALPVWLARAAQPDDISKLLARSIPEFATNTQRLDGCKIGGLRLEAATRTWTGTYTLTVTQPTAKRRQVIQLRGTVFPPGQRALRLVSSSNAPLGSPEWRWYLPELRLELAVPPIEPDLPILPRLTDPGMARVLIENAMRCGQSNYHDVRIQACSPEVLRHHPGLRATVRYRLSYPADPPAAPHWPATVVVKTYEGDKGQHAYAGMRALWNTPLASGKDLAIAEPIAYLPALKLLLQGPVPEQQTLKALIESAARAPTPIILAELHSYLHTTAVGLAALHRTPAPADATHGWAEEIADVRRFAGNLAAAVPELAGATTALLALLDVHAAASPPDPPVFAHGTFRPNQVLLNQGKIGLIDFDSWCRAEPALDLALFCTSLKDISLNVISKAQLAQAHAQADVGARQEALARADALCKSFIAYYAERVSVSRQRIALWETLAIFTLVLRSWDRVKPVRLEYTLLMLDRHLRSHFA